MLYKQKHTCSDAAPPQKVTNEKHNFKFVWTDHCVELRFGSTSRNMSRMVLRACRETRIGSKADGHAMHGSSSILHLKNVQDGILICAQIVFKTCTWAELVDQACVGLSTCWCDHSPCETELVSKDWHGWFVTPIKRNMTDSTVLLDSKIQDCKLGLFQEAFSPENLQDPKSTSGGLSCVFGSHAVVPYFLDNFFGRPTEKWEVCTSVEIVFLKTFSHSDAAGHLARPSGIFCLILLIIFLLMRLIMFQASFQIVHSQPDFTVSRTSKQSFVCSKKKKKRYAVPILRRVSRTHCVDLDWLSGRINLDSSDFTRSVRTTEQFWPKVHSGPFSKTSLMRLYDIHPPCDFQSEPWEVSPEYSLHGVPLRLEKSNALHQLCLERPNAFFGTRRCRIRRFVARCLFRTKIEGTNITIEAHIEAMWKSFGNTQLSVARSHSRQGYRCGPWWSTITQTFSSSWSPSSEVCLFFSQRETSCPKIKTSSHSRRASGSLSTIHQGKARCFRLCFVFGRKLNVEAVRIVWRQVGRQSQTRRIKHLNRHQREIATSSSIVVSLPHSRRRRSNSMSRRHSTTSARNAFPRRIPTASCSCRWWAVWMSHTSRTGMTTCASRRLRKFQRGYAALFQSSYRIFVRKRPWKYHKVGGRQTERQLAPKGLRDYSKIQRIWLVTQSFLSREPLKRKVEKWKSHFNASTETDSMMCMLIDSANHLCILLALMQYMDHLLEKTVIEAKESKITRVKLTPRVQESCAVPDAVDPLAEGSLLLEKREKGRRARPPTTARKTAEGHSSAKFLRHHTRDGHSQHLQRENPQTSG